MKVLSVYLFLLFFCLHTAFAQKVIVRGRVTDAKTGETLSDANVLEKNSSTGMAQMHTDSIPLPFIRGGVYFSVLCWAIPPGRIHCNYQAMRWSI